MQLTSFEDLRGKVCAITGGGGVIGSSLVRGLAAAGVRTAILDINPEPAQKLAASVTSDTGVEAMGVKADVLDRASLEAALSEIHGRLGTLDLLINGAGGNSPAATAKREFIDESSVNDLADTFFSLSLDGFRKVFDLNFMGTVLPTMVLGKDLVEKKAGAILNISSMNSFRPLTRIPAYSAAKASINNLTEWLAVHLARAHVRVNAVAPGFFLTDQNRFLLTDEKTGALTPRGRKIIDGTPMGRFGEPDELAGTVLYLLSDVSKFVTGIVIPVDGGFNAFSGV